MNSSTFSSSIRTAVRFAWRFTVFGVSLLVALELFLRTVLIATESPVKVLGDNMILRLEPDYGDSGIFTYGRYCLGGYRWRINNSGWNSEFEYRLPEEGSQEIVAIIGDSYLEGLWSDVDKHIDSYLTELSPHLSFYTFAIEGACLSQYVAMCQYEVSQYDPIAYIIFINDDDLVNSTLREYSNPNQILFQVRVDDSLSCVEVPPSGSQIFWIKNYLRHSALARYIRRNAKYQIGFVDKVIAVNNVITIENQSNQSRNSSTDYLTACATYLLARLNALGCPVLLVFNPRLSSVYNQEEFSYPETDILINLSNQYDNLLCYEIGEPLTNIYVNKRILYNPPNNIHWNAYANRCIAYLIFKELVRLEAI